MSPATLESLEHCCAEHRCGFDMSPDGFHCSCSTACQRNGPGTRTRPAAAH